MSNEERLDELLGKYYEDSVDAYHAFMGTYTDAESDETAPDRLIAKAKAELTKLIEEEITKARIELLDSLYWMYIQYCSGGHDFMGAGETASKILENAGYITVDGAGRITKDLKKIK